MERERDNSYFNNTEIKCFFFIFMRLLCSLNLCSQLLLFLIQSSFQHKVKASVMGWALAGLTKEGSVSARLHLPFKWQRFQSGFFHFVSVML